MNKIHNNLNIENLIKTEWFNQFDGNQKKEILKGLEDKLNVFSAVFKNVEECRKKLTRRKKYDKIDIKYK